MKKKTNISSLILVALVSVPYLLLLVFFIQQKAIQSEKREALEHGPVISLEIDASEVQWFKKNKELIIDNKLFDVKDFYEQNGKSMVRGFFDGDETELLEKLRHVSKNKEQLSSITFLSLLLGGAAPVSFEDESILQKFSIKYCCEQNIFFPERFASIIVPPPQTT